MGNPNDEIVKDLERTHAGWQVWYVTRTHGPTLWCARRHSEPAARFNASTPDELANAIIAAEAAGT
jgi:hypothetical protein